MPSELMSGPDSPSFLSMGRQPRALVRVNGTVVPGWLEWSVENNEYFSADTFEVVFAVSGLPEANNLNWFSQQVETFIEILAGFPQDPTNPQPAELQSLIYGRIDTLDFDLGRQTLTLTGRDLTGVFIDTRSFTNYTNQTSSAIAQALADSHGMGYTITETTQKVGNYFNLDNILTQMNRTEWDLLAYLARHEGFVCYVRGNDLYFGPDQTEATTPYIFQYAAPSMEFGFPLVNAQQLRFSRSQTVAKGITVTVMSAGRWNSSQKVSYPSAPKPIVPGKSSPYGDTANYYYRMAAGTTSDKLLQQAQTIYNEIIQHEMKMTATLAGDNELSLTGTIKVMCTGTSLDQTYFPKSITRTMSVDSGYLMTVEAQNFNPNLIPAPAPDDVKQDGLNPVEVTATYIRAPFINDTQESQD